MFQDFFYFVRAQKIPSSTSEYLDLLKTVEALQEQGQIISSERFYTLARNCLVKDIKYYDAFDIAFAQAFGNIIETESDFHQKLMDWLANAAKIDLSEKRKLEAMKLPPSDLIKELQKRLKEQKKRHDGGNNWIGTGGTSAFGNSGFNPSGIRVGGAAGARSALMVAGRREYKEYRTDEKFNIRQIKVALKKLRELKPKGRPEIHIKKSIEKTCQQAGEIDLVFEKSRKNNMKLVLLMDVGGSMTPYSEMVTKLFSAAHQINHFKKFEYYYFHNIFYDNIYKTANFRNAFELERLIKKFDSETRFIIVGDAYMAPYELFNITGSMREFYFDFNDKAKGTAFTGIERVMQLSKKFPKTVWLNPEKENFWRSSSTIQAIKEQIQMYQLTVDGIEKAIKFLKK